MTWQPAAPGTVRDTALEIARSVYGETAFARQCGDQYLIGWLTAPRQWEYVAGNSWHEALVSAGLVQGTER